MSEYCGIVPLHTSRDASKGLVVGIDATNLQRGGGVTHLVELLTSAAPGVHGVASVVVWGGERTIARLPERSWLTKVSPEGLNGGLFRRTLWQRFSLGRAAAEARCHVLFVPGGSYACDFEPVVTMSQNLLPFEWAELRRYGWSWMTLKLLLLRRIQSRSYRRAHGVIFLTDYAMRAVKESTGPLACRTAIIPHGLSPRFHIDPRPQLPVDRCTDANPFRVLYVSIVDQHKHQWHVVTAVDALRREGYPISLDLVGPSYAPALARLEAAIERLDPGRHWVHYHGSVPYEALHEIYREADVGVFASSCETFGMILLEMMAAGLPVASSKRSALPEVLGSAGLYFDPESPADIADVLRTFVRSPELRAEKAQAAAERCRQFSWERCADQTFTILADVARDPRGA